jgi:hypothetical protein
MTGRLLLVALALVAVAAAATAQPDPRIQPLIKGSMVATVFNSDEIQDVDAGFGFGLGGGAWIPLGSGRFVLQPEVMYVNRRAWVRVIGDSAPDQTLEQFEIQFQSLDIPLLVNWMFSRSPELDLFLQGGVVASVNLDAKVENSSGDLIQTEELDNITSPYWAAALGLGLRVGPIVWDIGYRWGLSDVGDVSSAGSPRMDWFNFSFGVTF